MKMGEDYIQAKFNYNLKTLEVFFNDGEIFANLIFEKKYDSAFEFGEVYLNKVSPAVPDGDFSKIKNLLESIRYEYVVFKKWKNNMNTKSRILKISNKLNPAISFKLRKVLLEVDYNIRRLLKKRGISMAKEADELRSIIEGKA